MHEQDPFKHLYRDSDVEGMSDGFDERTAYGFIDGHDDPSMGWARYAQVRSTASNSASHQPQTIRHRITDCFPLLSLRPFSGYRP